MKKLSTVLSIGAALVLAGVGIVRAASINITSTLGGSSGDTFVLDGTLDVDRLAAGTVTSATIRNGAVQNADLAADAVTTTKIAAGAVRNTDLRANAVTTSKIADGTITAADLAANAVTKTAEVTSSTQVGEAQSPDYDVPMQKTMTTGAGTLFISFSGFFRMNQDNTYMGVYLVVDGTAYNETGRVGNAVESDDDAISLAFTKLLPVTAGTHTVQVAWYTVGGPATMYTGTLDVIDFKR